MKILHLIDSGGVYGAEKQLLNLTNSLHNRNVEFTILSINKKKNSDKDIDAIFRNIGTNVERIDLSKFSVIADSRKIAQAINRLKPDIIHTHGYKPNILVAIAKIAFRINKPWVCTFHGHTAKNRISKIYIFELIDRLALYLCDAVIGVGEAQKNLIKNYNHHIISNGIAFSKEEPNIQKSDQIAYIGRLSKEKGILPFIESIQEFRKNGITSKVVIAGAGNLEAAAKSLCSELRLSNVYFLGYVENIDSILEKSKIVVMPSLTEGLPITILEATSKSTIPVCTKVGSIPHVLGDDYFGYIEIAEAKKIAESVSNIMLNYDYHENIFSNYIRPAVINRFSAERMSGSYLNLYRDLKEC